MPSHSFYVTAEDGGGQYQTVVYHLQVTDDNDNAPRFEAELFTRAVEESQPVRLLYSHVIKTTKCYCIFCR